MISWIFSLPQDAIKSKQQTHQGPQPLGFREAYNELVAEGGLKRLTRGMGPTLFRGYLVNMITLPMYDALMNKF